MGRFGKAKIVTVLLLVVLASVVGIISIHPTTANVPVVTLSNSFSTPSTGYPFERRIFIAQNRYWFFITQNNQDGFKSCPITSACNSDSTQWTSLNTNGIGISDGNSFSTYYDSGTNTIYYIRVLGGQWFAYRYGTPNPDGSITWAITERIVTTTGTSATFPSIFGIGSNNIWVTVSTMRSGGINHLEVWALNGGTWLKNMDIVSGGGTLTGDIVWLTGTQYALAEGDATGCCDHMVIYTTGNAGTTWSAPTQLTSYFSPNEAGIVSIGSILYLAGSVSTGTVNILSCAYPCSSTPLEHVLGPDDNHWATLATDGASTLVVTYELNSNTPAYVASTNLGGAWSNPTVLSSENFGGNFNSFFSGTTSASMVGGVMAFGWTDANGNVRFGNVAPSGAVITITNTVIATTNTTITCGGGVSCVTTTKTVTVTNTATS